jgi:UDP:flavonoid glycosyltransferase YjiC (YdhE family)
MASVLFTTLGSLGDLFPYLALATGMQRRGHRATILTSVMHRERIEASGIAFRLIEPDLDFENPEFLKRGLRQLTAPRFLLKDIVLPMVRGHYESLLATARESDLLVTHPLNFAGPLVAEKTGMPWVSTVLAPLSFLSNTDSPAVLTWMWGLREKMPELNATLNRFGIWTTRSWPEPVHRLRRALGLKPAPNPLYEGQHSPSCVLAMFSPLLASPQSDWPPQTKVTGFAFFDQTGAAVPPALEEFLAAGEPPIVFTLGSAAVSQPGTFYEESLKAVQRLGGRAIMLDGQGGEGTNIAPNVLSLSYAPHSYLFPKARVVVHSAGVGTCAQGMRSGRPLLVVAYGFDQPDNALRLARLGVARRIAKSSYNADRAVREISTLMNNPSYRTNAERVAKIVDAEDGARTACDFLEAAL